MLRVSKRIVLSLLLVGGLAACDADDSKDSDADEANSDGSGASEGEATDGGEALACGDEWQDKEEGVPSVMEKWGAPCSNDQECIDLLGYDNAFCVQNILGVYELPGGYCSRRCEMPDTNTTVVENDPNCDPDGGINCIGVMGTFEACAKPCTSASECGREGYGCTIMPTIGKEEDPTHCLMNPDACLGSAS